MAKARSFFKRRSSYLYLLLIVVGSSLAIYFGVDKKVVGLVAVLMGLLTQAFVALLGLIALIPILGPVIVKLLSIPIFWIMSAVSNFMTTIAVKRGLGKEIANSKLLVLALIVGMIVGYLLGHWFPF